MMYLILLSITFAALIIGSLTDIKTREVPDWLSYSLIFIGLGLRAAYSSMTNDWNFMLEGIIGLTAFFTLAMLMFYAGQWGGGDSKMMMGIGALVGLGINFNSMPLLIIFLINLLLMGAVYGIMWSAALAIIKWDNFTEQFSIINNKTKIIRRIMMATTLLILISALMINDAPTKIILAGLALIIIASYYMWAFAKSVEKSTMYRLVTPDQLTEGDWIAKEVKVQGKLICGPKDLGIEKKQIEELQRLYKQHKIKQVLVKDGIPFVPSFLLAFTLTILAGNWIAIFI